MPWELPEILDGDLVQQGLEELQPMLRLEETLGDIGKSHLKVSALEMTWYMRNQLLRDSDWAGMATFIGNPRAHGGYRTFPMPRPITEGHPPS